MREERLDLFNPPKDTDAICITTNGMIRSDGKAVMGRGVALAAKNKFLGVDSNLALALRQFGNHVNLIYRVGVLDIHQYFVFSFPTKNNWKDKSNINLIIQSCNEMKFLADKCDFKKILLPRPGCANGGLSWSDVKPVIESILDDRFTVVTL